MQGRILVVDDLPDVRQTVTGLLKDAGYFTRAAGSRAEALVILQNERFHVAVLDVRLDESDEDNQEGLELLAEISRQDASMAAIMLTGYAEVEMIIKALQPTDGSKPAYRFLRKNEILRLNQVVPGAFDELLRLNLTLEIDDPQKQIEQLAGQIRFPNGNRPEHQEVCEQVREIFGRLFYECEKIRLENMQQGFGGAAVFQVTPFYRDKGEGQNVIVKVGDKDEIRTEKENYDKFVKGIVGGHRVPEALNSASTRQVSGIQYSFIGLGGQAENFASFYLHANEQELLTALENLYLDTLFPLKQRTGRLKENCNLGEFYLRHLHLRPEKFQKVAAFVMSSELACKLNAEGQLQFGAERLPNPLRLIGQADFSSTGFFTTIHGDLNGQNILLDQHQATWLIDFLTTTDDGHLLQDYAALETDLRFRVAPNPERSLPVKWAQDCLDWDLSKASLPLTGGQGKARRVIRFLRELATQTPGYSERAYLIALFFNTLRTASYITACQEAASETLPYALYCAAKIAERLLQLPKP